MRKLTPYYFILPAVIMIIVVALFPVGKTFYYSFFDIQLNHPCKTAARFSCEFDLEKYLENYLLIKRSLSELPAEAAKRIKALNKEVKEAAGSRYVLVQQKMLTYKNIAPGEALVDINDKNARKFRHHIKQITAGLNNKRNKTKIIGMVKSMQDALLAPTFIGWANFKKYIFNLRLWQAVFNTTAFTIVSVFLELVLGLIFALMMNKVFRGRNLFRSAVLIPWAIPTAVAAVIWGFLLDGQNGIVAKYLSSLGLVDNMGNMLSTAAGAFFSMVIADVWKTTPYMALLLLAGLQSIPGSLYESAAIDGAGVYKRFRYITLPLLKHAILVALLFRTLDSFRIFDLVFVLTGGGPANATETVSVLAYKKMFSQSNFGEVQL